MSAANIFTNAIAPVSGGYLAAGTAEYVTVEVFVSWLVRYIMGMPRGLLKLSAIHGVSLPFIGGAAGFVEPTKEYGADYSDQFVAGTKGEPAVLLAHYIVQVFERGFTLPNAGFKEYIITAISKILSRPLASTVFTYLPTGAQNSLAVLHALMARQAVGSNFASGG